MSIKKIKKHSCVTCVNRCFIKEISDTQILQAISEKKEITFYEKKQQILSEGNPVHSILFIYSGKVKEYKKGIASKQQIVRFSNQGDILGHRGINSNIVPISATALEDTVICSIPRQEVLNLLQNDFNLIYKLLMFFADELNNSEVRERNMAHMTVPEKIADTILYLKKVYGIDKNNFLNIDLSRKDIAYYAGTTKEQVSKTLSDFKNDGIIDLDVKSIQIIHEQMLKNMTVLHSKMAF